MAGSSLGPWPPTPSAAGPIWLVGSSHAPGNYYLATPNLRSVLTHRAGSARTEAAEPSLRDFGQVMAEVVEPAVVTLERHREFPAHVPFDPIGRPIEAIEFHPDHRRAGRAVWGSGLLAVNRQGRGAFEQVALFYLLSLAGEGGHSCPAVCTAGLARAIERRGSTEMQERFLPGLFEVDYDRGLRGSQFLTEIQGGSDVGANTVRAVPDPVDSGAWRITGEKWFCSVADAELFAVTARPEGADAGTRGLGCFLVPRTTRRLDPERLPHPPTEGQARDEMPRVCGDRVRRCPRLADRGGLRRVPRRRRGVPQHLPLAQRGRLDGFDASGVPRSGLICSVPVRVRPAGRAHSPRVREQLAIMKAEEYAALASTMALTGLLDRVDRGDATDREAASYRVLVNANKFVTSIVATDVVHRGIEVLGGNGTIETFSPLPRLYRDAIVYESWEGTHNVLCAQVQRDAVRLGVIDPFVAWVRDELSDATSEEADRVAAVARRARGPCPALARRSRRGVRPTSGGSSNG